MHPTSEKRPELNPPLPKKPASKPFNVTTVLAKVRRAIEPFPKAMLFELAEKGFDSPFEQLVACVISIRTLDETSGPVAERLFEKARTPRELAALGPDKVFELIRPSTFARQKAGRLVEIARRTLKEHDGHLPCDFDALTALPGVGPKCANLVLGIACGTGSIGVDIHVHRVTNRWGYVRASTPEKTREALEVALPKKFWVEINALLVPFGKHICTGSRPKCSTCPVLESCRRVGVTEWR